MMTTNSKMRLVIIVFLAQAYGLALANEYPFMPPMLGDAPGGEQAAFEGDYYDGPAAVMPLSPSAVQKLLMNADPSLLLSVPASTPLLCRMFPNTVRCLQYRFPFNGASSMAPRADTDPSEPADVPQEEQAPPPPPAPSSYHTPLSYQYVLMHVPSPAAVHPAAALFEPCRVGFHQDVQSAHEQPQQQQPQQPVSPCPGVQKPPTPSTQTVVAKPTNGEKVPEVMPVAQT